MNKIDFTRRAARFILIAGILSIAAGYAAAFKTGGAPDWAAWLLAVGIPASVTAIMALGAARGNSGLGKLKIPFAFVFIVLAAGFCLALWLPADESIQSPLWLGLPARAAIVIYGVGLLPVIILPIAYALTFDTQTLNQADIDKVRELAAQNSLSQKNREADR